MTTRKKTPADIAALKQLINEQAVKIAELGNELAAERALTLREELLKAIQWCGTFGGRLSYMRDGRFEYIGYTD